MLLREWRLRRLINLTEERLKRRPVHVTLGRRRFRVTRPLLAMLVRWWRL